MALVNRGDVRHKTELYGSYSVGAVRTTKGPPSENKDDYQMVMSKRCVMITISPPDLGMCDGNLFLLCQRR